MDEPPLHESGGAGPDRGRVDALLRGRGYVRRRTDEALEYIASLLPMAVGSVDRLEEIPERLQFLFDFDPAAALQQPDVAHVLEQRGARDVILALPDAIQEPLDDKETFRARRHPGARAHRA